MNAEPRFLVDSNILVYAFDNTDEKKRQTAIRFLVESTSKKKFFLSAQNLAETLFALTKKVRQPIPIEQALIHVADYAETARIISYSFPTIQKAGQLLAERQTHFWDALLAATMLENSIRTIYTENTKDFEKIRGIKAINPLK